jgi:hypothetical protein
MPARTRRPAWSHQRTLIHVASSMQVEPILPNMQLDNFRAREIPRQMGLTWDPGTGQVHPGGISSGALARGCPALRSAYNTLRTARLAPADYH